MGWNRCKHTTKRMYKFRPQTVWIIICKVAQKVKREIKNVQTNKPAVYLTSMWLGADNYNE